MPAPVKWSAADFELVNAENPEGEPWIAAAPDGRFTLTFFESFAGPPVYTDIETRLYSAAGSDTGLGVAPTFSATTIDHQGASAYLPDGRQVFVWTEEPAAGGGNLEDVYASVYVGSLVSVARFLVAGGAGIQHDPVVAASISGGFAVALADDSVAGGRVTIKFYNNVGTLVNTVLDASAPEGVYTPAGFEDDYRNVEITALANGNYVVTWSDDANFDIFARVYSTGGVAVTGIIDIEPGGSSALWPEVTALADGRFLVTYEQTTTNTVRGRIFETNGTASAGAFTITTDAASTTNQQVQSAALNDGRFVTVWRNLAGNIEGQVMFANGTPDGAAFAVNSDGAGGKGRPTVATLADGRFVVSWESGSGSTMTIFSTIFDPRETGLYASASSLNDDWHGTGFADVVLMGAGNDVLSLGAGNDIALGEAGADTLNGQDGIDTLNGGFGNDTLNGGSNVDTAVVTGNRSAYTVTQGAVGVFTVTGPDGTDVLTAVEYVQFADQLLRLLPGTGTAVDFNAPASTWMGSIRDFDGNNLGGVSGWRLIGSADVNGDGDSDRILVNPLIGRFAEVATGPGGLVYFSDHGWAGETRVVGIYIDPEVIADPSKAGGPFDSQRRFQNDLLIDNIAGVLGAADYDRDGLQEVYFRLTDGTAYLHAYMHADGNIRYANYQSQSQVIDYLTANGWAPSTWAGWFPGSAEAPRYDKAAAAFDFVPAAPVHDTSGSDLWMAQLSQAAV